MQGLYLGLDTANLYRLSSAVGDMGVQPFKVYILLILIFYSVFAVLRSIYSSAWKQEMIKALIRSAL
jgi:hypothetical protein